ncbi:MAG: tetratricopeptide repeat protein [Reyranella sp.]|uniref:tetratricopeptide repeat protein n=1 Tax=Reyranella sp. TaxID=1929291 RepID=UPI002730F351|nr:tetratricopeptide repeat protein [Reyranella sp.]MDP1963005.1 tetratricopeptide repeat protein [Reyranella sp.]MDP2377448.1 tetratricopeptide repeat protein [Reyranella sp.]
MSDAGIMTRLSETIRKFRLGGRVKRFLQGSEQADFHRLYYRARVLARSGAFELAVPLYQRALDLEPTFDEAMEGLGEALDILGQTERAMETYAAARRIRAGMRLGAPDRHFVLRQRGHFTAEVLAYDSVVRSLKKNVLPYIARGNAYLASGQPKDALANYNHALKLKRDLPAVTALKGEALSMLGRYSDAVHSFDAALKAQPDDAEALSGRAIARLGLGGLEEANTDWQRQFKLLEGRASARACVALRMADYAAALPELECALGKEPNDPYWHLYRFTARRRLGLPADPAGLPSMGNWPGLLLSLLAGRITPDEALKGANTEGRRAEAMFQLGVLAFDRDRRSAEAHWKEVVENSSPSLIEHAAASNELARFSP